MTTQTLDVDPDDHYLNSTTPSTAPAPTATIHSSDVLWALMHFTLPPAPAGEVLISASLVVRTTTSATSGSVPSHTISLTTSSWSQATSWAGNPAGVNMRPSLGTVLGTVPANTLTDTVYTIPLDIATIAPLAGSQFGMAINTATAGDSLQLWSSRAPVTANQPDLVLVYAAAGFTAVVTSEGLAKGATLAVPSGMTFPPKAQADALVAGPTISSTIGIATTISGAALIPPNDSRIRWRGATGFAAGPSGSTTVWAPNNRYSYAWNSPPVWGIEFVLNGTQVEASYQAASGAYSCFRIKIDGQRVTDLPVMTTTLTPAPTGGQRFMLKLTFGTSAVRRITIEGGYLPFGGLYAGVGSTVSAPPPFSTKVVVQGDSIVASSSETPGLGNGTWPLRLANYIGADEMFNVGVGGTGYLNTTPVTFINRIADLRVSATPAERANVIIFFGGVNDRTQTSGAITTAAQAVFDAAIAAEPQAEIYVFGCWVQAWPVPAANITVDNALKAAAAASGVPFASCTTGNCYNAAGTLIGTYEPIIRSTTDVANFIGNPGSTDTLHPNGAGNVRIAEWAREVLILMAGAPSPFVAAVSSIGTATARVASLIAPTVTPGRTLHSYDAVTLTATLPPGTSADIWERQQIAGVTVTIGGGFGSYSFIAPPTKTGTTITIQIRYQSGGVYSDWTTVSFPVERHQFWRREGGVDIPYLTEHGVSAPVDPSPNLFFALPDNYVGTKMLWAHYYPPYPVRLANVVADGVDIASSDYYVRNYINPVPLGSSEQQHIPYGGILRTRPMPLPVYTGPDTWQKDNARREIAAAIANGVDGFLCNSTNVAGDNTVRILALRDIAAAEFPGFYVTPMLDLSTASPLTAVPDASIATYVAGFANLASTKYLPDGRMIIGSFQGDTKSAAWWTSFMALLASSFNGLTIAVMGSYNSFQTATEAHKTVLYASGQWGYGADPNVQNTSAGLATEKAYAAARGIQNLRTIWFQDIRPYAGVYDEARNTEALRAAWTHAIADDPEYIELCTFGDLKEGSDFRNTESRGLVGLDISAYYAAWWKIGSPPDILRDVAYLTHRQAPLSAVPTGPQTQTMQQWKPPLTGGRLNTSTPRESVEALVFLTAPAEVRITSNGTTQAFSAPAGMSAWLKAAGLGAVKVEVWRNGLKVVDLPSPVEIKTSWQNDQREYDAFGSIRGTTGQRASWPRTVTTPPPSGATPWLPFELNQTALNPLTTGKWTLSHPMDTYYVSIDNPLDTVPDYWDKNWMYYPPIGATGQNVYGGLARQRYARRLRRPEASGQFEIKDYRWEVRAARSAGIDAFTYAVSQRPPGSMFVRVQRMLTACAQENAINSVKFYCIPWILGNTGVTGPKLAAGQVMSNQFVIDAANYLAGYFSPMVNDPLYAGGFLKINGEAVFMPYNAEVAPNNQGLTSPPAVGSWGVLWWQTFRDRMASLGTPVRLWFTLSSSVATHSAKFESLASAMGWFGSRDWALNASTTGTSYGGARSYLQVTAGLTARNDGVTKMPYIAPVSTQGYYPRGNTDNTGGFGYIWEAKGTQNLINSWTIGAVNQSGGVGTEMVQGITWNDVAEGSQVFPSSESGWHWLDLFLYFNIKHKTGSYPVIVRDGIYLTHRKQQTTDNHAGGGATYSGVQTKFATRYHDPATGHAGTIESPILNILDGVVFLTAAATVNLVSGGVTTTFSAPAGFSRFECPLRLGTQSGTVVRAGVTVASVTSPIVVSATQVVEDLTYYGASSFAAVPRPVPIVAD